MTSKPQAYCFQTMFLKILEECCSFYNLDDDDKVEFISSFLFSFSKFRKNNDLQEDNQFTITWEVLQSFISQNVKVINNISLINNRISNSQVQNIFREYLKIKKSKLEKDKLITFVNLNISLESENLYMDEIVVLCIEIIKLFSSKKENIPFELFKILYIDIFLTIERNSFLLKNKDIQLISLIILDKLQTPNRFIPKPYSEEFYSLLRIEPPYKKDFLFNTTVSTFNPTYSLELLIDYFGHTVWYKSFPFYDKKKENEYFCFFEEPFFKLHTNKRINKFEDKIFSFSLDDFFKNNNYLKVFKVWEEERLFEKEIPIFKTFIIPAILNRKESITLKKDSESNLDKIIQGIRDTSHFSFSNDLTYCNCSIIGTISSTDQDITVKINTSMFKGLNHV